MKNNQALRGWSAEANGGAEPSEGSHAGHCTSFVDKPIAPVEHLQGQSRAVVEGFEMGIVEEIAAGDFGRKLDKMVQQQLMGSSCLGVAAVLGMNMQPVVKLVVGEAAAVGEEVGDEI